MLKNRILLILLAIFLIIGTGCAGAELPGTTDADTQTSQPTAPDNLIILDKDGRQIGNISGNADFTATDKGIFYSVVTMKENSFTGVAEYRLFSFDDNKDHFLGKLEEQGYEASYGRVELNGLIYTTAVKGSPYGDSPASLLLLAFDPAKGTMKTYTVTDYGFPYTSVTTVNGKLLIMNHEMTDDETDKIYRYDPDTEKIEQVLSFSRKTDSLRGVYGTDDGFYLLRLKINGGAENELYIDKYDNNINKKEVKSVNGVLADAVMTIHGITGRQDALNELGMYVSRFALIDGRYLIYENFGLSRVIADLQSGNTLFANDDNYAVSTGGGDPVLYRIDFNWGGDSEPEISGIENGKLKRLSFKPDDSHKMIQRVSRSKSATFVIMTSDDYPIRNGTAVIHVWMQ